MAMKDMALSPEEMIERAMPTVLANEPRYPYSLSLCLGNDELEKLGLDSDCEVGDHLHLQAIAKVTSVSKNDTGDGEKCRIELQIVMMDLVDGGTEEAEAEPAPESPRKKRRMYFEG